MGCGPALPARASQYPSIRGVGTLPASGRTIGSLPLGDELWISLLIRDGRPVQAQGDEVLQPGDEVLALGGIDDVSLARALFESPG